MKHPSKLHFIPNSTSFYRGFTLTELLIVIAILAVLAGIVSVSVQGIRRSAQTAREISGGRNLVVALGLYAADNNGFIMPGYDGSASVVSIEDSGYSGNSVSGATAHRYPWRLAPYFDYGFEATTALDRSFQRYIQKKDTYMLSLATSLGMNVYGVGGYIEEGSPAGSPPNPGALTRMEGANDPSSMIAFISTRMQDTRTGSDQIYPGFHMATPRLMPGGDWSSNYDPKSPGSWGNVDMRHKGKALACFLDGSIALLDSGKLRDMRNWSNQASINNDPDLRFQKRSSRR